MNYFAYPTAAKRYATARPYFHPRVIHKIKEHLHLQEPLKRALDVACGTGQSTRALKALARDIVGIDSSQDMLTEAVADPRIHYLLASAEQLPFPNASFDLVSVSMAFHWFKHADFLREATRVLRPNKYLVIYNHGYLGEMLENPSFSEWNRTHFLKRYPTPEQMTRYSSPPVTYEESKQYDFLSPQREKYSYQVTLTPKMLADYLMTLSSVIRAVEQGNEDPESAHGWLLTNLQPLFKGPTGTFLFGGDIDYLQKHSEQPENLVTATNSSKDKHVKEG